jgi:hypothetical protein
MLELIGIAAVIFFLWKLIKAIGKTSLNQSYHAGASSGLSLADATAQYDVAKRDFIAAFWTPGSAESDNIQSLLDRAVFLKDRINQLTSKESGSAFRATHRLELLAEANQLREVISEALEADEQSVRAPLTKKSETSGNGSPAHGYATFEEWLEKFKLAAGKANEHLAGEDGQSLIDFMELTPLRNGFAAGIDPTTLGTEFGEQFDFAEFIGRIIGKSDSSKRTP